MQFSNQKSLSRYMIRAEYSDQDEKEQFFSVSQILIPTAACYPLPVIISI